MGIYKRKKKLRKQENTLATKKAIKKKRKKERKHASTKRATKKKEKKKKSKHALDQENKIQEITITTKKKEGRKWKTQFRIKQLAYFFG